MSRAQGKGRGRAGTIVVAVLVAVCAGALLLGGGAGAPAQDAASGAVAVVHDGDGNEEVFPLGSDTTSTVTSSYGTNTVVVEGGAVRVTEADCPNHDCIEQGSISAPGEQIVCLPHKLWIEVVAQGASDQEGFDVVGR